AHGSDVEEHLVVGWLSLLLVATTAVPADTVVYRGDRGELEVAVPRVASPSIRVDGRLAEPDWSGAAVLTGFTQFEPVEGAPASQETEVRVLYGPDAIYFGILARDTDPSGVRASLTQRDEGVTDDDWVRISLDTFNDNAQAYVFYVNPRGIQADGLWVEGAERRFGPPIDFNPDFLWESAAEVTPDGWSAELRIPYVSLRFRESTSQRWGLNIVRQVRRTDFQSAWAPLSQDAANQLELSGLLTGMEGLEPHRLMELNPVLTGKRTGELDSEGRFVRSGFEPAAGFNARYGVTRNLVLDATFNPDFSQVEADADQVAVNERFALFFPEKRPFFLEGTEVFNTPQQLVYTRAIADPVGGAKLTGKLGAFNVGYMGAVDESPVTFDEGASEAAFNMVRVRRDVGSGSNVGVLYADRTLLDGSQYNRVGAIDTRLVRGRYSLTAQLAGSWSREDDGVGDGAASTSLFGPMFMAELARSGRVFSWELGIEDVHPEFRARSGFIRRTGDTQVEGEVSYTFLGESGAFLEDWGPQLEARAFFDHDRFWAGDRYHEAEATLGLDVSLRGANGFNLGVRTGYFAFNVDDFEGYEAPRSGPGGPVYDAMAVPDALRSLVGVRLFGRARPSPWLSLRGRFSYGEVPIYAEGSRGVELAAGPTAAIRFPFGLAADASFTYSRIERDTGGRFSLARIPRLKLQYQFTPALFVRGILQYNLQERDALRMGGVPLRINGEVSEPMDEGELRYELLVSYEPSPGTIVYAGWSRLLEGTDGVRARSFSPAAEGLFLKVSYLFRL
ncbi:MAG: DUF5916 domain-containing protein, partial [Gemmatimonadota bacterium]